MKHLRFFIWMAFLGLLIGCGEEENIQPVIPTNANFSGEFQQIERLARPAINEALVFTNDFLNAFNSIPPSADLSDAAAPVREEVVQVLNAVDALDNKDNVTIEQVVAAFLPDVMRIDLTQTIGVPQTAYNACASERNGILCGGRKIEDDVIDITLSFLVAGDASRALISDNVFYGGVPGNTSQPGHSPLLGQRFRKGPAVFPFLATPY